MPAGVFSLPPFPAALMAPSAPYPYIHPHGALGDASSVSMQFASLYFGPVGARSLSAGGAASCHVVALPPVPPRMYNTPGATAGAHQVPAGVQGGAMH
ncbi:hypothetical protein KIPB_008301 [Kipferlia bialata]|uniref:Uncharacterized protein n=1 Tax=Kipferlia bialata TaxID=797122 RepID=A0A391NXG7_9EUKA|nr:hypothetical protein KIPB_008301 [Kipferlia bialata]|eukprot:g8301.t1